MAKVVKSYSFNFSFASKSSIKIRRIHVSKKLVHSGLIALFLTFGISTLTFGISGVMSDRSLAGSVGDAATRSMASLRADSTSRLDYTRPAASGQMARNSGGPASSEDSDGLSAAEQVRAIQTAADPMSVPSIWAHLGKINNEFGFRRNPFGGRTYEFHAGMDIDGERGDVVAATANGTVVKAGWQGGYGNMIEIDHGNGVTTRYGHLSRVEVKVGDSVFRGQSVGAVGSTGRSTGPHLHYEVRINDHPINPRYFLPPEPADLAKLN
ncbi:MAG: M23 family metallopeptidase [Pyrinomonadaceae bacterium]